MKLNLLSLLLVSLAANATDSFGVEEPFPHPVTIPAEVLADINSKIHLDDNGCGVQDISSVLEASKVTVSTSSDGLLIKPKSACLCGTYYCPMWLYQLQPNGPKQIWSTPGTGFVQLLKKKTHGYHQIKEGGETAGHGYTQIWAWNGSTYKVIKASSRSAE